MAHKTLILSGREAAHPIHLIEDVLTQRLRRSAEHALAIVSSYDGLLEKVQPKGSRLAGPRRLTLSEIAHVVSERRRTVRELSRMSDGDLRDMDVPREAIAAIASLTSFTRAVRPGQLTETLRARPAAPVGPGMRALWEEIRREVFPTDAELDEAYLAEAGDIFDLESRMRELDRRRARRLFA